MFERPEEDDRGADDTCRRSVVLQPSRGRTCGKLLSRFEIGSAEKGNFGYCGKQFPSM